MNILKRLKAEKNKRRLLGICEDLITKYEEDKITPTCKRDLMEIVSDRVELSIEELSEWEDYDTDYIEIAHTLLAHATFDLLASGKYHIYYGILNPMGCSKHLMEVYKACMEYCISIKQISEEEGEEQYEYLLRCISQTG